MKILLFGEFSGFFTCLKDGLKKQGYEVFLVSDGNGYKNFPADFRYDENALFSGTRLKSLGYVINLWRHRKMLRGYDIVFFMDASILSRHYVCLNAPLYRYMIRHNKKSFLCGAGDTAIMSDYWYYSKEKYHHYIAGMEQRSKKKGVISLVNNKKMQKWEKELFSLINGYIPIWYEYAQPFRDYPCIKKTIRIPIPIDKFEYKPNIVGDKVVFFHGISTRPEAKGTPIIEKAFDIMREKYSDEAEFIFAKGLPFNEYMDVIKRTNIILDNTNGYSVAMNGLFSMAQGKVVMGGAEPEGNRELEIEGVNPVINLKPDVDQVCAQIEYVIKNKDKIEEWGLASRKFVEKYHNHIQIADEYISTFLNNE